MEGRLMGYEAAERYLKTKGENMSNTTQEVLTVEAVTQYGFRANGKNYSISTRLAGQGVKPQNFIQGAQYNVEVWTGPQGGKKINSYQPVNGQAPAPVAPPAPVYQAPAPVAPPMPPALPATTVAATPAPGGVPPVTRAGAGAAPSAEDKMSKADWADRNREIAIQAILKSSIESPALAEHVTGK